MTQVAAQVGPASGPTVLPPTDDEDAQNLVALIGAELDTLQSETEAKAEPPATDPDEIEKGRAAAAVQLVEGLKGYQSLLKEVLTLRAQLRLLTESASVERLTAEISTLQERVKQTKEQLRIRRPVVTEDEIREAELNWRTINDDLMIRTAARTEQLRNLAEAAALKQTAEAEVQAAQAALLEETARAEAATAAANRDAERATARYRLRQAQIRVSQGLLRVEQLRLQIERDTRRTDDAEQVLPVLRELAEALDAECDRLKKIRVRSARDHARGWADAVQEHPQAYTPFERVYWPLRLRMIDAVEELERMRDQGGTTDRFTEEKHHDLSSDLAGELAIWNQFVASLDRRPREQVRERFRSIGQRIRFWQIRRDELQVSFDKSFDDRAAIELRLNELDEEIRLQFRATRDPALNDQGDATVTDLRQRLANERQTFNQEIEAIRTETGKLCDRLSEAVKAVTAHVEILSTLRSRLYWAYLSVSDTPLWKYRFAKSAEEWNQDSRRQKREKDLESIRTGFDQVTQASWISLAALVGVSGLTTLYLRYRLRGEAAALEAQAAERLQAENLERTPLSDRLHFHALRFLGSTLPIVAPGVLTLAWLQWNPLDGRIARAAVWLIMGTCVARAVIRTAFDASKPRFRLLPCTFVVARYYRRWWNFMLWISVLLVPIPLFLTAMEWAFYTRSHMWAVYTTLMLVLFLGFLSRRQIVLKVVGRPEDTRHPFFLAVLWSLYPVFYLYIIAHLVAQVAGYSALTTYLIVATNASLATLIAASLLLTYVGDLAAKLQQRLRAQAEKADAAENADLEAQRAAALAAGREVVLMDSPIAPDSELPITILTSLLRVGVWFTAAVLTLGYWGVSWVMLKGWMGTEITGPGEGGLPPITLGRAGLALLVLGAAWMFSRTIRSILETRVFPSYALLDRGGRVAVNTVLHYLLLVLGLYFAMFIMRIPLGAVTVILGTLGLGLGLASQPLFMNFLSGLIMLFERHVKVGDMVEINGVLGEVTGINIRATTIKTFDNVDLVVPNSEFVSAKVVNWTLNDARIRGKLSVGVAYGSDPRKVERLLLQVAHESKLVLPEPPPGVRFVRFGDSSLEFNLYAWFRNVTDRYDFVTDAHYRIMELFQAHGVEIPFPQREFSFKDDQALRVQFIPQPPPEG